jgi:hypothetical protein
VLVRSDRGILPPTMTPVQVVLLVAGILAFQALIWIPALILIRRKTATQQVDLTREIERSRQRLIRGPEPALYRGASAEYPKGKGNGVVALTDRRLLFRKLIGKGVEVHVSDIAAVREDTWFLRSYRSGRPHVIVKTRSGAELGFIVARHGEWMEAIRSLIPETDRRASR